MKKSEIDRLGERLRTAVTSDDLRSLDAYRRDFRYSYDEVVGWIRSELNVQVTGRPAKSTTAIVDKLRRGSMRLTQMQDIAGCRAVVPDIAQQESMLQEISRMFKIDVIDRRQRPSHGYRAVHTVVRSTPRPVEIQIRTDLQHTWAELSEKVADFVGFDVKYGGGPDSVRQMLERYSRLISELEADYSRSANDADSTGELRAEMRQILSNLRKVPEDRK